MDTNTTTTTPSPEYIQALTELREELINFIIAEREKQDPRFHWVGNCVSFVKA